VAVEALVTRFAGVEFRSRLEARWAHFFENAGVPWRYEPKWLELPSGPYLPDFWLPDHVLHVEVKPQYDAQAVHRLQELVETVWAFDLGRRGLGMLLTGEDLEVPWRDDDRTPCIVVPATDGPGGILHGRVWSECPACGGLGYLGSLKHESRLCLLCGQPYSVPQGCKTPRLRGAFQAAQRARF